ncbi:MAG: glycosyltransferase family 9 protein [Pyrinomonadaceae bacterium]
MIDLGQMGDVVLSMPALRAISERYRGSFRVVLVGSACAELVRLSGLFDEVIEIDRVRLLHGKKFVSSVEILRFAWGIRRRGFDIVIDLHSLPETNLLGFFSGAPTRLFAHRESRSIDLLSNVRPRPPKEDKSRHASQGYLDALSPLGIEGADPRFWITPTGEDTREIENLLPSGWPLIGLNPGAGNSSRRWPAEGFRDLAISLGDGGCSVVIFLGPEDSELRDKLGSLACEGIVLLEGLSLRHLAAAYSVVDVVVGNDTGPVHIASAVGANVIVLVTDVSPRRFLPMGENVSIVSGHSLDAITVFEVKAAIERRLTQKESEKQENPKQNNTE